VENRDIWLHSLCEQPTAMLDLAHALKSGGLNVREWSGLPDGAPGVILFDCISTALFESVLTASDSGRYPVLAIRCCVAPKNTTVNAETWRLLEAGATDILFGSDTRQTAGEIIARVGRWGEIEAALTRSDLSIRCVGKSLAWQRILHRAAEGALFSTAPLLLTGESGTGKEMIAKLVHELDRRPEKRDLVVVDCTTLVRELSGSELFGHVRGAFTGAVSERLGAFAMADGGTLFLDEIGELSLPLQGELLRVVQEGTYKAVGANIWKRARFRLIAATHRDLSRQVAVGEFRHDLFHRIAGWCIELPPLRDRVDDIQALANYFLAEFSQNGNSPTLSEEVAYFLNNHVYPGNVRQLRNILQRAMVRYSGTGPITPGLIAPEDRPSLAEADSRGWLLELERAVQRALACGVSLNELARQAKECAVRVAVRGEDGNLQRAARRLGVTDRTLQIRAASNRGESERVAEV
jgi:transcriptional regulator with GAF, ATPase, and Fis domain